MNGLRLLRKAQKRNSMSITNRFNSIGTVLLPIALLAVFFKYLHPLISILHGIENADLLMVMGVRKTIFIFFISFFAIWALLYISFVFFVRITKWVWSDTNSSFSDNSNLEVEKERQRVKREESSPTADEHLDKMDDPEKNNKEESKKE